MSDKISRRAIFTLPFVSLGSAVFLFARRKDHPLPDPKETGTGSTVTIIDFSDSGERLGPIQVKKIVKTDAEWKAELDGDEYAVARRRGTEPSFGGRYWNNHKKGLYRCICCANALYRSEEKFESGTGWPSFWAPIAKENIFVRTDSSYGMERDEVVCRKCDAHLGHVFNDGPKPTGLRYCMNSVSMRFVERA